MQPFLSILLCSLVFLPLIAEAQFGPIIPEACRTCACGFGGVLAIIQNVVNFLIGIAIIFATIIIVWAGSLYVLSATNPESRSTANKMLINAAVGLLIVLSAWLIVDFVMKTLYDSGSEFGPWNSILAGDGTENSCIVAKPTSGLFTGSITGVPGTGGVIVSPGVVVEGADGVFSYQSGVQAQADNASPALQSMLQCMANKVPANVGQISAITSLAIERGELSMAYCAANGSQGNLACGHTVNSCHFGGRTCVGSSYAVDFGDEQNAAELIRAANMCGAKNASVHNGTHVHATVENNCGCN